jgi:hypothetical protein
MRGRLHVPAWRLLLAGLIVFGMSALALGQSKERKLGTCGPPPRKNPERQTSAEGNPPLPLPATPLRRSEPKAEPAPPLMIAKLEYGILQDWNTDPGDVDNLMRQVRDKLNLWYGWKHYNVNELAALHKAGKQCNIPILYMSGHEAFEFSDAQRAAIKQYVLDGGTFLGDACCGRPEFADSFRREVRKMFPDRSFDLLEVDHPIFRAFYSYDTVHYLIYDGGVKKEYQAPPQLLGMNIGCRTAVILTPYDLSCGWDGHTHERGARVIPGDAVRLGINLVSYVAAERQLGEVQAVTREIQAPATRPRGQFTLAQLRHQGDWNPDPNSIYQWMRHVAIDSSLAVGFELKSVDADEAKLAPYPFLFMTGHRDPKLSDKEVAALRQHLQAGGFLFVNNCCGRSAFDQHVRTLAGRLFPDQKLEKVAPESPLYRAFPALAVKEARDRQTNAARPVELEGIVVKDRLVLVYSKNDMVGQLKQVSDPFGNGYDAESCRRLAVNIVAYALQN